MRRKTGTGGALWSAFFPLLPRRKGLTLVGDCGSKWGVVEQSGFATQPHPMAPNASNNLGTTLFVGEFRHGIDPKNRITIPAGWRSGEKDDFFLRIDSSGSFILVLPPEEFRKILTRVETETTASPRERQEFIRHFSSGSQECSADKQGRMVLPPDLCEKIGLKGDAVLVGFSTRFEIWNPQRWEATQTVGAPNYQNLAAQLGV